MPLPAARRPPLKTLFLLAAVKGRRQRGRWRMCRAASWLKAPSVNPFDRWLCEQKENVLHFISAVSPDSPEIQSHPELHNNCENNSHTGVLIAHGCSSILFSHSGALCPSYAVPHHCMNTVLHHMLYRTHARILYRTTVHVPHLLLTTQLYTCTDRDAVTSSHLAITFSRGGPDSNPNNVCVITRRCAINL